MAAPQGCEHQRGRPVITSSVTYMVACAILEACGSSARAGAAQRVPAASMPRGPIPVPCPCPCPSSDPASPPVLQHHICPPMPAWVNWGPLISSISKERFVVPVSPWLPCLQGGCGGGCRGPPKQEFGGIWGVMGGLWGWPGPHCSGRTPGWHWWLWGGCKPLSKMSPNSVGGEEEKLPGGRAWQRGRGTERGSGGGGQSVAAGPGPRCWGAAGSPGGGGCGGTGPRWVRNGGSGAGSQCAARPVKSCTAVPPPLAPALLFGATSASVLSPGWRHARWGVHGHPHGDGLSRCH